MKKALLQKAGVSIFSAILFTDPILADGKSIPIPQTKLCIQICPTRFTEQALAEPLLTPLRAEITSSNAQQKFEFLNTARATEIDVESILTSILQRGAIPGYLSDVYDDGTLVQILKAGLQNIHEGKEQFTESIMRMGMIDNHTGLGVVDITYSIKITRSSDELSCSVHVYGINVHGHGDRLYLDESIHIPLFESSAIPFSVRHLIPLSDVGRLSGKISSFEIIRQLGIPYPGGAYLNRELVARIAAGDSELLQDVLQEILDLFKGSLFSVRSSPPVSMPGLLGTVLNLGMVKPANLEASPQLGQLWNVYCDTYRSVVGSEPKESDSLRDQLRKILVHLTQSWSSNSIRAYRQRRNIPDEPGTGLIFQNMVFGNANENSGSGVLFSRNPNTGEEGVFGDFKMVSQGIYIVSGRVRGDGIAKFQRIFPAIYAQLATALMTAENQFRWPVEVEFTIENGIPYALQIRKAEMSPPASIHFAQEALRKGAVDEATYQGLVMQVEERLSLRPMYRVQPGISRSIIARGTSSLPGAMAGVVVRSIEEAAEWSGRGEGIIFISTPETREELLERIYEFKKVGVILADYGNDSAHEVVALRSAGIPVVIGVDVKTLQQLKSGTQIILDGDSNTVLTSDAKEPTAIHDWIHDASYGINISALKQQVKGPYLMQDGILSAEATLDRMKTLYLNANEEYLRTRESASQVEIFIANLKQHFFHELYLDALRRAS